MMLAIRRSRFYPQSAVPDGAFALINRELARLRSQFVNRKPPALALVALPEAFAETGGWVLVVHGLHSTLSFMSGPHHLDGSSMGKFSTASSNGIRANTVLSPILPHLDRLARKPVLSVVSRKSW